eukprot:TRINITY_DN73484_c0_g1_i1.p1 TRINITY_DN73484_c0_g1~~TRINITY_DN73484_c0_g1_i1.p1  ORF type:complete len:483 (+),score=63.27 TRINITY_DN73484_c0_g1_i1:54-1502(+)
MGLLESRFYMKRIDSCVGRQPLKLQAVGRNEIARLSDAEDGFVALELIAVRNAPNMDIASPSDIYVVASFERDGKPTCGPIHFPYRKNGNSPTWNQKRLFPAKAAADCSELVLELFDYDDGLTTLLFGRDHISTVRVPIEEIRSVEEGHEITKTVPLTDRLKAKQMVQYQDCTICFRLWQQDTCKAWPTSKWIFLIRHGESKWNQAQANKNVLGLLEQVDHGLSVAGLDQACRLATKVRCLRDGKASPDTLGNAPDHLYSKFLSADEVCSSPLTRAAQTAVVALQHHPKVRSGQHILLRSNFREIRNFGGLDTCGDRQGEDIPVHVLGELQELYSEASRLEEHGMHALDDTEQGLSLEERLAFVLQRMDSTNINPNNTTNEWWTAVKEDEEDAYERVVELLIQWKLSQHQTIIGVGHSDFFRLLCSKFLSPSCLEQYSDVARQVSHKRIANCGVMALHADFTRPVSSCITDIHLLFSTPLPD